MKDSIRCCISCIFPCGGLDVVRIVHASGRVEEISGIVSAGEVMRAYPKHVLRKPPSASLDGVVSPKAVILPPSAELQRGKIYFLMPVVSSDKTVTQTTTSATKRKSWKKKVGKEGEGSWETSNDKKRLLPEVLQEKASAQKNRRRGRVGVWRPHLESISEVSIDL
ncbi:hypothetical protein GW17_00046490 [Ensete ventricosum]|nr:hypothetical protein GW17_00046490 [Ensete ventricosum]